MDVPSAAESAAPVGQDAAVADIRARGRAAGVVNHRRFALLGVTFAGAPLPSATVDVWEDVDGAAQWVVRALARSPVANAGRLTGCTVDGRELTGEVRLVGEMAGPGHRANRLVELRGCSPLDGLLRRGG